jgi:hypothetical protein
MRAGLIVSLARKFARSRSLALSTVVTLASAAVLVGMFIAMKAFTLSGEQVANRDLGRFSAQLDMSTVSNLRPGDSRFPDAVLRSARAAGARDAVVSLTSFDVRPDIVRPPIVLYVETDWSANPFPKRYVLDQGRWPTRPGEVVLTQSMRKIAGTADSLSVLSGNEQFRVVGVATDTFDSFARILAASGTWSGFSEASRRNFSTVLATPTLHWNGDPERVVTVVTSTVVQDRLVPEQSPEEITAQLAAGLRTRSGELAQQRRSWIERIPLAYQVPSLALPLLSVLAVFGLNNRRFRGSLRVLTSIGMSRATAVSGVVLATTAWTMISVLVGGLIGVGLGLAARPICDHFLAGPISPFPNVAPPLLRLVWVSAVSCLVASLVLFATRREPQPGTGRSTPQRAAIGSDTMPPGATVGGGLPRAAVARIGGMITPIRRFGALAAGLAAVAQIAALETVAGSMIMAGTFGLAVLLLTPELVDVAIRALSTSDPRARLGRRQLVHDKDRAVVGVAVLTAALGAPLGMLTLLATLLSTAQADVTPAVAPHQVVLSSPAGALHPPSPDVVRAVTNRVAFDAPPVQVGYLWTDKVMVTVQDAGMGTLLVVNSPDDAARLNNAPLSTEAVDTLREGGMLLWRGNEREQRSLLVRNAETGQLVSTTEPLRTSRVDFQSPWDIPTSGVLLAATAQRMGLDIQKAALVFTGVSDAQAALAKQAAIGAGLDSYEVGIYEPPKPITAPPVFYIAAVGLALVVLVTAMAVARAQVLTLRGYVGRLIAVGLSTRWVRQVLLLQSAVVVATSTLLAMLMGVLPVVITALRLPDFSLSIPWQWLGAVLVAFYGAVACATLISSRGLRAADRLTI